MSLLLNKNKKENIIKKSSELKVNVTVGKNGFTDGVINEIKNQLKLKKIIKIRVFKLDDYRDNFKLIANNLALICKANLINIIGHTIVLYKK